jgi:hypothetical protein
MKESSHPTPGLIEAFARGRTDRARWKTIEQHVLTCPACARHLEALPEQTLNDFVREVLGEAGTPVLDGAPPATVAAEVPAELKDHPRYEVLRPIGSGGMGHVFLARHRLMDRQVALKVIQPTLLANAAAVERFRKEVRAAGRLLHPNIVTAFDADQAGSLHFLVMEYVEGMTLDQVIAARGPVSVERATDWVLQLARGLGCAHENGMVHRDLKPGNVLVTPPGALKILDFGLARFVSEQTPSATDTPSGVIVGTPAFLAPEQARDPRGADIRADLYSLGCTWYFLLTGQPPFPSGSVLQQLLAHQDRAPLPVSRFRSDVPAAVTAVLERLLTKDPERRCQTPRQLVADLDHVMPKPRGPHARRTRWLGWMALGGMALATGLLVTVLRLAHWGQEVRGLPDLKTLPGKKYSAVAQAINWFETNSTHPRKPNPVVADITRQLDLMHARAKAFTLLLGDKLVKADRLTLLAGRQTDFFTFHYPPEAPSFPPYTLALTVTDPQSQEFDPDPVVTLTDLRVDNAQGFESNCSVRGAVNYGCRTPVHGKSLCLRLTYMFGKKTLTRYLPLGTELQGKGRLPFSYDPIDPVLAEPTNAHVLFFDFCAANEPGRAEAWVLSNTVAEVVLLRNPGAAKKKP